MPPLDPDQARCFSAEVQPHEAMLRAWLRGRFDAWVEVDEIVQESFARVLAAHRAGTLRAAKPFLFATARNLALDRLRRHDIARTDSLGEIDALNVLDESGAEDRAIADFVKFVPATP